MVVPAMPEVSKSSKADLSTLRDGVLDALMESVEQSFDAAGSEMV